MFTRRSVLLAICFVMFVFIELGGKVGYFSLSSGAKPGANRKGETAFQKDEAVLQRQSVDEKTESKVLSAFGKVPLHFVANHGWFPEEVSYYAKSEGATVYCTDQGLVFGFAEGSISLTFSECENSVFAKPEARGEFSGKVNYFSGNDPASWRTDIPTFKEVVYPQVYPGIDLVYSGDQRRLKYTFYLQPNSNPNQILMIYDGIESLCIDDATGELVIQTPWGEMRDAVPIAHQEIRGIRKEVDVSFRLIGETRVGFAVGDYDPNFILTLDPGYSTYLGGSGTDVGRGIALDSSGNAYITGFTTSPNFPTQNPYQDSYAGGWDVLVTKLSSSGNTLVYSTYLGGSGNDEGSGIAVDSSGNTYVTGWAQSGFPTTPDAYQETFGGGEFDTFVAKLNSSGNTLDYSSYLGGSNIDMGYGIAVDSGGNAYVTGHTHSSTDFPITENAYQGSFGGVDDVFVTKFESSGETLIYSTYLGGSNSDYSSGIAVDSEDNAYVTGRTFSSDFPTQNPYQSSNAGSWDAFVTKLDSSGNTLIYSTYLGGGGSDYGRSIAVDSSSGNAYVTGEAQSGFPPTTGAYQQTFGGGSTDAFVTKLDSSGNTLNYSSYLGGSGLDVGYGIAVDSSSGNAYITGNTDSSNFPTTTGAYQENYGGGSTDAFVTKLNSSGNTLLYSTYLGESDREQGNGIAVDSSSGNAYVTGSAQSGFPTTPGAYQETFGGGTDAFVTSLGTTKPPPLTTWHIETVDSSVEYVGSDTSIALDSNDYPHISYHDDTNTALKYAYWDGSVWQIEVVDSEGDTGYSTSLALDSNGRPHISYRNPIGRLTYAYLDGSDWQIQTVDLYTQCSGITSLALDSNDYPHISYFSSYWDDLTYAYWDGSVWQIEVVDSEREVGDYSSLALDSNDYPHISYFNSSNRDLKYAYWDGSVWQIEVVDSVGEVGCYTSLVMDNNDYPHISYFTYSSSDLKYAYWDGSVWQIEVVDSVVNYSYTSLALDSNGFPHISYGVKYTYWDGSVWQIEIVDSKGWDNSLALDRHDRAHISYYYYDWNNSNGNLKYATTTSIQPNCVWPGDTNNDGKVDQADVLPLGLHWGRTGPPRQGGPSCAWECQPAEPWEPEAATYADANGDEIVNQADVLCIGLNWELTPDVSSLAPVFSPQSSETEQYSLIKPIVIPSPVKNQFTVDIKVEQVSNLFGLAFALKYTRPDAIKPVFVEAGAFLGSDVIFYPNVDDSEGTIRIGMSRKRPQSGVNGSGIVAKITFQSALNLSAVRMIIQEMVAINSSGKIISLGDAQNTLNNGEWLMPLPQMPSVSGLSQNFPNPFNPETWIPFQLKETADVTISIYDASGKVIRIMNLGEKPGGFYTSKETAAYWDGRNTSGEVVASGVYFYAIRAGKFFAQKKMIVVR